MTEFQVVQGDFVDALGDALIFAANDLTRPMLTAVYLEGSKGDQSVTFTATDRFILGQRRINTVEPLTEDVAALIPAEQVKILLGVHKAAARARRWPVEPLQIKVSDIYLTAGQMSVPLDTVNPFVKYRSLWPTKTEPAEILSVNLALLARLAKLSVFGRAKGKLVRIRFSRVKDNELGRYAEMISVECPDRADDTRIAMMAARLPG